MNHAERTAIQSAWASALADALEEVLSWDPEMPGENPQPQADRLLEGYRALCRGDHTSGPGVFQS